MPKPSISQMSNIAFWIAYAPIAQDTTIIGATAANGTRKIEAKTGTVVSTSTRPTILPRYIEAIRPHTKSLCSTNSRGPGLSPHTMSPPSRIAAVPEPGMPSASMGKSADVPEACAAVSGANTPSMRPVPKLSGSFEKRFARLYPMNEAAIAPPGVMPSQQPMNEERNSVTQYFGRSFQTDSTTRRLMLATCPRNASRSSMVSRISLIPNSPITATRKLMPRSNSPEPSVMRNCPDTVSIPTPANSRPRDIEITVLCFSSRPRPTNEQNVSRYTAKNSGGPNLSANDEISGARNVIRGTATSGAINDDVNAGVRASAALPCCALG